MLKIFEVGSEGYEKTLESLSYRGDEDLARVEPAVKEILAEVKARGESAALDYTEKFDGRRPSAIKLDESDWKKKARGADSSVRDALQKAADRIREYHAHQVDNGFKYEKNGVTLGSRVMPVRAAGVYAPGGKARYPSTVLMTAIPAAVAGVKRIVLATPNPTEELLAAAEISGVTEVLDVGGAQAIAVLAYGTESVERVDKIVGPGNIFVACAKRLVFGTVSIDSIAGPSEILVIADEGAKPEIVAADLLSQAEHDEEAYPLLITWSLDKAKAVAAEVERQLAELPRQKIAKISVEKNGYAFVCETDEEVVRATNMIGAEHLSLSVSSPEQLLPKIEAAGAIFMGYHTPEAAGDYAAGPSHVLPTGGAVRHSSPLGVYDFVVRSSLIQYSDKALQEQSALLDYLAKLEGLEAHGRAVTMRVKKIE